MSLSVDFQAKCVAFQLENRRSPSGSSSGGGGGLLQDGLELLGLDKLTNNNNHNHNSMTFNGHSSMRDSHFLSSSSGASFRPSVDDISQFTNSGYFDYDHETLEHFCDQLEDLACAPTDVADLIDTENFRNLQQTLRSKGCVTNMYIQLKLHKYVKHVRAVKERKTKDLIQNLKNRRRSSGYRAPVQHRGSSSSSSSGEHPQHIQKQQHQYGTCETKTTLIPPHTVGELMNAAA